MKTKIIEAMARVAFADAWGTYEEEHGRTYPGGDLCELAPATPLEFREWAWKLAEKIESANGEPLDRIFHRALNAEADAKRESVPEDLEDLAREFGSDLALQSMGHGVSWFDDHARFPLALPYVEGPYLL